MGQQPNMVVAKRTMVTQGKWFLIKVFGEVILCQDSGEDNPSLAFISGANLETDDDGNPHTNAFVYAPKADGSGWAMMFMYDDDGDPIIRDAVCPDHLVDQLEAAALLTKTMYNPQVQ